MQRTLRGIEGPHSGAVFVLDDRATIGRAADCDIQLLADGVSRQHAEVFVADGTVILRDLGSQNGTYVGDTQIVRQPLRPGDVFTIGRSRFLFELTPKQLRSQTHDVYERKLISGHSFRTTQKHTVVPPGEQQQPPAAPPRFDPRELIAEVLAEVQADNLGVVEQVQDYRDLRRRRQLGHALSSAEHARLRAFERESSSSRPNGVSEPSIRAADKPSRS